MTGGIAVADLTAVIGLLYRADWTRLSLSGELRSERDGDLAYSHGLACVRQRDGGEA